MANSPGDFTGKKKEKLAKANAKEQAERAKEVSMVTAAEDERKSNEVVDYTKEKPTQPKQTGPVDLTAEGQDSGEASLDEVVAQTREEGGEDPAPVAVSTATRVEKSKVRVRARFDLEQVTIGKGNHYDFEAGRQYLLPPNAAEHLAERDLVDVLD
jgi:hypothetical protein